MSDYDLSALESCKLCGRNCGVNRLKGEVGFCKSGKNVVVAKAYLHKWEEPCISGYNGSGTVFFSNCNLNCVFCQNHEISQEHTGLEITIERLAEIFINLQEEGAHNINLVTPGHYVPQIIEAIKLAKINGLTLPILYNTNSYENVETIKSLNGYIDVYLPDLKYFSNKYSEKYSNAPKYFMYATKAIKEMYNQVGKNQFNEDDIMIKGVIIRHLMLPGLLFDSKKVMDYIFDTYGDNVYISLMNQYTPMYKAENFKEINRPLKKEHYDALIDYCLNKGIKNAFIQDEGTCSEGFVPKFDFSGC